ncbi:MAG TPA: lytic transglycosylase domain-containing protein [Solirubrobacterales bacterium]|nr:lytic transglycosylase domain-containing protein [Solirubrobacterales bacterium]
MSSRTGTRRARAKPRSSRRHTRLVVAGLVGLLAVVAVINRDEIGDQLREVTLPLRHEDIIRQQSRDKNVPPDLIAAVIYAESRFRDQESHAGARGLMQVTPQTAELIEGLSGGSTFVADDLSDPDINIRYGTFYLRYLLDKFNGNLTAGLAAYNAGETNVAAWGGSELQLSDIEFEETRDYVESVLEKRDEYREHYSDELGL